jgi:hypothetical protein
LESAYYDGSSEEWEQDGGSEESEEDASDDEVDTAEEEDEEINPTVGDALFTLDILEPASAADAAATPYTLLRSLASPAGQNLPSLALPGNEGIPPPASKFAKAAYSLSVVLPKGSSLHRFWLQSLQTTWTNSLETLNIHNDTSDEIPHFCRQIYLQLQEQHRYQRSQARKARRAETAALAHTAAAASESKHSEEDVDEPAVSPIVAGPVLVLPDATCDFVHNYQIHEQMRAQKDVPIVLERSDALRRARALSRKCSFCRLSQ